MKLTYTELQDLRNALVTAANLEETLNNNMTAMEYRVLQRKVEAAIKTVDVARKLSGK